MGASPGSDSQRVGRDFRTQGGDILGPRAFPGPMTSQTLQQPQLTLPVHGSFGGILGLLEVLAPL